MLDLNTVNHGDCLDLLKEIKDNSVDAIVTDPPYGLSFMGKKWDYDVPSQAIWEECLRVLKPGGYLLAFAGTRTQHRMAVRIEDAGFEIRDMIAWVYGSGFPKSMDIGKAIDKMLGTEYPKNTLISNNSSMAGGNYTRHTRFLKQEQAKEWEGWGTALKPALEPITVARKPLELTVAQNVLKYGTGGLNIDECRIPLAEGEDPEKLNSRSVHTRGFREEYVGGSKEGSSLEEQYDSSKGRFPANLIHDGSEEVVRLFPESGGSVFSAGAVRQVRQDRPQYGDLNQNHVGIDNFGDKGSAARFFYCPKASKSEKGIDTKHPTVKPIKLMEYLIKLVSKENALILDPFGGSGTTALACKNVNRNFILIERESEYVDLAKERILQSTPDESGLTFE